jgi:hypothetical protein
MALASHRWPWICPAVLGDRKSLPLHWWAYFVRASMQIVEADKQSARDARRGR